MLIFTTAPPVRPDEAATVTDPWFSSDSFWSALIGALIGAAAVLVAQLIANKHAAERQREAIAAADARAEMHALREPMARTVEILHNWDSQGSDEKWISAFYEVSILIEDRKTLDEDWRAISSAMGRYSRNPWARTALLRRVIPGLVMLPKGGVEQFHENVEKGLKAAAETKTPWEKRRDEAEAQEVARD